MGPTLRAALCFLVAFWATIIESIRYARSLGGRFNDRKQEINWRNLFNIWFWLYAVIHVACGFVIWLFYAYGGIYLALVLTAVIVVVICVFHLDTLRWSFVFDWILAAGFFGVGAWIKWGTNPVLVAVFYLIASFLIVNALSRFICLFSKK